MRALIPYLLDRVLVILQDGRVIIVSLSPNLFYKLTIERQPVLQGTLAGYDQKSNVVLSDSMERVYSTDEPVEEIPLGLYLVKGDQM